MNEIDELEGRELADAVCVARGLKLLGRQLTYSAYANPNDPAHQIVVRCDEPLDPDYHPGGYRPDFDIAQAWELDGERWFWRFEEHWWGLRIILETPDTHCRFSLDWSDFPTKANAYATARCRAFLKARGVTR